MSNGTAMPCPRCGYENPTGFTFTNVKVSGLRPGMSAFHIGCPRCGHEYDAGQGDGTYSTIDGRLTMIETAQEAARRILATSPTVRQLQLLQMALQEAGDDDVKTEVALKQVKGFSSLKALLNGRDGRRWVREGLNKALDHIIGGMIGMAFTAAAAHSPVAPLLEPPPPPPTPITVTVTPETIPPDELQRLIRQAVEEALQEDTAEASEPPADGPGPR